jgi:hypothetical protein
VGQVVFKTLRDFVRHDVNIALECSYCKRTTTLRTITVVRWFNIHLWNERLDVAARRFYCVKCRRRPSLIRPCALDANGPKFFPTSEREWDKVVRRLRD